MWVFPLVFRMEVAVLCSQAVKCPGAVEDTDKEDEGFIPQLGREIQPNIDNAFFFSRAEE